MRRTVRRYLCLALPMAVSAAAMAQAPLQPAVAAAAFQRMQALCTADAGKAWGAELCGPTLLADPATRRFMANMDGLETSLERDGAIFRGRLPDTVPVANTAVKWNGRTWTMLMLPLPQGEPALSILLMHEAWHRIQGQIGLAAVHADQEQLETEQGRLSLRLELRALAAAVAATDPQDRLRATRDALTFRAWRQARFPEARQAEDAMERHEGIAEYTGRLLSQDAAMTAHLADHLRKGDGVAAYARSFAYYTGPAYGVLLDSASPGWRTDWNRRDGLPAMLASALGLRVSPDDAVFAQSGARYGMDGIRAEETARAVRQATVVAALRARLVDGPVLVAPVKGASFSFDPNRVTPLPPEGAAYATIRAATAWGVLEVEKDGLLSTDWSRLSVQYAGAQAAAAGLKGDGWSLALKPGWVLVPGARAGDWTIRAQD